MKVIEKTKSTTHTQAKPISLSPLNFEQALENLLQVKPEKKVVAPKKKSKQKNERGEG